MEAHLNDRLNSSPQSSHRDAGLLAVGTLVLWCACMVVGLIGLFWPRDRSAPVAAPPPIDAELLTVEATSQRRAADANSLPAPALPAEASPPPELPEVTAPSPAVAFAMPVNAPVHVVKIPHANAPKPVTEQRTEQPGNSVMQPSVIQLTFGEGEGEQPAPEYPPEAVIGGEEGTVVVRLTVGEDGRVTDAVASTPCNWPLLNNAAVRVVRTDWRFSKGPVRSYEVSIEFHLNRHE
jgi:TonB family protein